MEVQEVISHIENEMQKMHKKSAQWLFLHPVQVCFCETLLFLQDQKYKEGATLLRHSMLKKVTS